MVRTILAVIAGYVTLAILVMLAFSVAVAAPDFAFQPQSTSVTPAWLVYASVASVVAAAAGGAVAAWIGRGPRPAYILAGLMLVFGIVEAIRNSKKAPPNASPDQLAAMSVMDKAQVAVQPVWYSWSLPLLGAAGVLAGAAACRRCGSPPVLVQSSA